MSVVFFKMIFIHMLTFSILYIIAVMQMLEGLSQSWEMRWRVSAPSDTDLTQVVCKVVSGPVVPSDSQVC